MRISVVSRRVIFLTASVATISYPFLIYFGAERVPGFLLLSALFLAIIFRCLTLPQGPFRNQIIVQSGSAIALVAIVALANVDLGLFAYPIVINLLLAVTFGWSLLRPPTIIERLARIGEPNLPPSGQRYTRNVTLVWLIFFLFNAITSLVTAVIGDLEVWWLYNGFIAYFLMGFIFAVELIVRQKFTSRRPLDE